MKQNRLLPQKEKSRPDTASRFFTEIGHGDSCDYRSTLQTQVLWEFLAPWGRKLESRDPAPQGGLIPMGEARHTWTECCVLEPGAGSQRDSGTEPKEQEK